MSGRRVVVSIVGLPMMSPGGPVQSVKPYGSNTIRSGLTDGAGDEGDEMTILSLERFAARGLKAQRAVDAAMPTPAKCDTSLVIGRHHQDGDDLPEYVTRDEVQRACAVEVDLQVRAFVGFLWGTGARVSEALAVRPRDVDVDHQTVKLPTLKRRRKDGKGRKTSAARVIPVAGRYLSPVLGVAVAYAAGPQARLFPWGRQHAWTLVSAALRAAGVEPGRATPHALRHGHAVHAVLHGVPLNLIQRQLGHASIVTTAIYLRVTGADVREAYDRVPW